MSEEKSFEIVDGRTDDGQRTTDGQTDDGRRSLPILQVPPELRSGELKHIDRLYMQAYGPPCPRLISTVLHFPQQTAVISDKYTYQIHMITSSIWN